MIAKLNNYQIKTGQNIALENARELFEVAHLAYKYDKLFISHSLLILSFEELGKIYILPGLSSDSVGKRRALWKEYKRHEGKLTQLFAPLIATSSSLANMKKIDFEKAKSVIETNFNSYFDQAQKLSRKMNSVKKFGLYTDFKDGKFIKPGDDYDKTKVTIQLRSFLKGTPNIFKSVEEFIKYTPKISEQINR